MSLRPHNASATFTKPALGTLLSRNHPALPTSRCQDPVWTGTRALPVSQQGLLVLGAPFGCDAAVQCEMHRKRELQDEWLHFLLAWLDLNLKAASSSLAATVVLLLPSASGMPPAATEEIGRGHHAAVERCSATLPSRGPGQLLPEGAKQTLHLPLRVWRPRSELGCRCRPGNFSGLLCWADRLLACSPRPCAGSPTAYDRLMQILNAAGRWRGGATRHAAACLREQW